MKTQGIRISDGKGKVLLPTLYDILEEITDNSTFYWSILFLDGMPNPGQGAFLEEYEKKINDSENGLSISWDDLIRLSSKFFQMYEVIILGCKDKNMLHRYKKEEDMYKLCDIVIDLIDCAFWEVFSKKHKLIQKLKLKFKETEILEPGFEK